MDMAKGRSFSQGQNAGREHCIHGRMPVILPDDMRNDWLNLKDDVMRAAVTEVMHRAV